MGSPELAEEVGELVLGKTVSVSLMPESRLSDGLVDVALVSELSLACPE